MIYLVTCLFNKYLLSTNCQALHLGALGRGEKTEVVSVQVKVIVWLGMKERIVTIVLFKFKVNTETNNGMID